MGQNKATVVGGSFSGSYCARELCKLGVETAVLEEHANPGKFHKCSGLFSRKGLEALGVSHKKTILNTVHGARIMSGNSEMVVRRDAVALVCDRQALDEQVAREAIDAGAEFVFSTHAESFDQRPDAIMTRCADGKAYSSKFLVGADGCQSAVARELDFPQIPASDLILAYEGEFTGCAGVETDLVHVILDALKFPGFLGWVIPVDEETARIGFGTRDFAHLNETKRKFLESPHISALIRTPACRCSRDFAHLIPLAVRGQTQRGNVLLIGDAAGQVKSTTGGGIVFNGQCAAIAAREIAGAIEGRKLDYENAWRKKLGGSLKAHRALRKAYDLVPNALLPPAVALSNTLGISRLMGRYGDMDYLLQK